MGVTLSPAPALRGLMGLKFIESVQCRNAIAFGKSRVIKNLLNKISDSSAKIDGQLPNMNQLSGPTSNDMHRQNFQRFGVKNNLNIPVVSPVIGPRAIS